MPYQDLENVGKRKVVVGTSPAPAPAKRKATGLQGIRLSAGKAAPPAAIAATPKAMAEGGSATPVPSQAQKGLPPKRPTTPTPKLAMLKSEDTMPKPEAKEESKQAPPSKKKAGKAKKDHSGDPRYTTPPFTPKADQSAAKKGESRAEKVKRLNAKSKQVNAEHRASKPGRPAALADSTGKDWMRKRGSKVDRR